MKFLIFGRLTVLACAVAQLCRAQAQNGNEPAAPSIVVLERGPDHRLETSTTSELDEGGNSILVTNSWTSVATGMHYWEGNEWKETVAAFEEYPEVFVAQRGPHKVILNRSFATPDLVDLMTADGTRLRNATAMLVLRDRTTGQAVLLAEPQPADGRLVAPNVVVWENAFDSLSADVRATYTAGGFELDIILRERPPNPTTFGIEEANAQLEVFTEILDQPQLQTEARILPTGEADEVLTLGSMMMDRGVAFGFGEEGSSTTGDVLVGKRFQKIEGRDFLIESVPYQALKLELDQLPAHEGAGVFRKSKNLVALTRSASAKLSGAVVAGWWERVSPQERGGHRVHSARTARSAQVSHRDYRVTGLRRRVVLDYTLINTTTNYTFKSDTTYLVQGAVNLSGTVNFEGGTVIKYANTNSASISSASGTTFNWQAGPYRPVVLTAQHDNSSGEIIAGNTNVPSGYYASKALSLGGVSGLTQLHNFRISFASTALDLVGQTGLEVRHGQFVNCSTGIKTYYPGPLRNLLFANVGLPLWNTGPYPVSAEHVTVDTATYFPFTPGGGGLSPTNCLIMMSTPGTYGGAGNVVRTNVTGLFASIGAGSHYLADGALRDRSSVDISASLRADLASMTTASPTEITNHFTVGTTLYPTALRDADELPDVGYHYWPIDWLWTARNVTNATLLLTNGVVVAHYGTVGTILQSGGKVVSGGSPLAHNRIVRYQAVQEQPVVLGSGGSGYGVFSMPSTPATEVRLRFTDVLLPANSYGKRLLNDNTYYGGTMAFTDCHISGATLYVYNSGTSWTPILALTNNVMERCDLSLVEAYDPYGHSYPMEFYAWNNLFNGGVITVNYLSYSSPWAVKDNLFASFTPSVVGSPPAGNNGYTAASAAFGGTGNKTSLRARLRNHDC